MIRLKIDGHVCESETGATVIEVADKYGIAIPRFCYHSQLSVAANCRMCLVMTSTNPRPVPACATPISDGMEIFTSTDKVKQAQQSVLEFLLINHPLDCPICDQGGECELQDLTLRYGADRSHYDEEKRQVGNLNLGPLIATEMNRCIHCTRCVRFGSEIAGYRELGGLGRGEDLKITNALHENMSSSISGNVIDLCPVGALTSKPHRYQGRTWQYHTMPTISYHDSGRSRLNAHVFENKIHRIVSQAHLGSFDYWISDRDRFGFLGAYSQDRFEMPCYWSGGRWHDIAWSDFYGYLEKQQEQHRSWAGWFHPMSSEEEKLLLEKYLSHMYAPQGVFELSHRRDLLLGSKEILWDGVEHILLLGSFWESQQPIMLVNLRQWLSQNENRSIHQIGLIKENLNLDRSTQSIVSLNLYKQALQQWIHGLTDKKIFVIVQTQIWNYSSDYWNELFLLLKKNNINYYVLGIEAPIINDNFVSRPPLTDQVDCMVTLHLEPQDWAQDRMFIDSFASAKTLFSFTSMRPSRGARDGHICIPIAAPGEYAGTYYSIWQKDKLFINGCINQQVVLSFSDLISQWLETAPVISPVYPATLHELSYNRRKFSNDHRGAVRDHKGIYDIALIVLKNPMAINMILRRSKPLQETPVSKLQRGFWISSDLNPSSEAGVFSIEDCYGLKMSESFLVSEDLPPNTIIYWSGYREDDVPIGMLCRIVKE